MADPASATTVQEVPEEGDEQPRMRQGPPTQPYYMYFRRREPDIVFGSQDCRVPNDAGPDGRTFLDTVWGEAPFQTHEAFVAAAERVAGEWGARGTFAGAQRDAIIEAARRAEGDLRV